MKYDYSRQLRFEEEPYRKAEEILNTNGLNMAEAFRIFVDAVVASGGLPFTMNVTYSASGKEVKVD